MKRTLRSKSAPGNPVPARHLFRVAALCLGIAGLNAFPALAADDATTPAPISWYGMYLQKGKLGSAIVENDIHATHSGKPAVQVHMTMNMDLQAFGAASVIKTDSLSWSDPKTGAPQETRSHTESAGRISDVTVVYTESSLTYTADIQGSKKTETLTLKPGEHFLVDPSDGASFQPHPGEKLTGKIFSSDTLQLVDAEVDVLPKETVVVNGEAVQAYKILEKNPLAPSTDWVNDAGDLLRVDMPLGMQMIRQPKEVALAAPSAATAAPDLVAVTSITPSGMALSAESRKADLIIYSIEGVTRGLPPNDTVQSLELPKEKTGGATLVRVHPIPLPSGPSANRFASPLAAPERLRRYLSSTVYVTATDPQFVDLAKKVVGDERDIAKASAKIAAFVHKTIAPDPSIAALRTAPDIAKEPRGVCRDYTTYFTAIARAAGIPTKQCVGLGYGELPGSGGRFIGHAWPEVWTGTTRDGKDRWVALEPTWGEPFADPTHIKLAEGEITDFFSVAGDLENYKIKVIAVGAPRR